MLAFLKNKFIRFKYWILSLLAIPIVLAFIPVDIPIGGAADSLPWNTIAVNTTYDTVSGRLEEGQFASTTYGWLWINDGVTESKRRKMFVGTSTPLEIKGLKQVNVALETCQIQYTNKDNSKTAYEIYACEDWYTKLEEKNEQPVPKLVTRLWKVKQALAGIAYQSDTDTACSLCSSASFSFTTSGSDRGLVVLGTFDDGTDADRDITASTYGGITLTQGARGNDDTNDITTEQWYIANPLVGANTLSITLAGTVTNGYFNTSQYTGVLTTGMSDANNSAVQTNANSISYTITTVAANTTIVDGAIFGEAALVSCVPNSGQTEILDIAFTTATGCSGYELEQGAAGAKTVSWSCTGISCAGDEDWTAAGMSLAPESEQPAESTTWWDTNFLYRRKITFNNAPSQQTLTNFPVNIFLTQNAEDQAAPNNITYANVTAQGGDIRFVDADQTTMLKHEIEDWDTSATSTLWVKVPKITATSTTDHIWMYYGNTATSTGAATSSVWDSNFKGVWHLAATSTAVRKFVDSTSNAQTGIATAFDDNEAQQGVIDGSIDLEEAGDFIDMGDLANLDFGATDDMTITVWINRSVLTVNSAILSKKSNTATSTAGYSLMISNINPDRIGLLVSDATTASNVRGATGVDAAGWNHISSVWDDNASGGTKIYLNGKDDNALGYVSVGSLDNAISFKVGGLGSAVLRGTIDEVRISNSVRSSDWIQQEYRYGLASSTTHTYGTEENVPVVGGAAKTSTSTIFKSDTIFKSNVILNYLFTPPPIILVGGFIQSLAYYWRRKWN